MADILGAAAAVVGLLDSAARVLNRIRKAYERQQQLSETLGRHAVEVDNVNDIVRTITDQDGLQTSAVATELAKLHTIGDKLVRCLKGLDPTHKGRARQLAHQLLLGSKNQATLADIMTDLDRVRVSLILRIQLANIGLTRTVHNSVIGSAAVINRVDGLLAGFLEEGHNKSSLAELSRDTTLQDQLTHRAHANNNLTSLSKVESSLLDREAVFKTDSGFCFNETVDRIITGNSAQDAAIQLLGPVGEDLWVGARVRIQNNAAKNESVQVAYPTSLEAFKYMLGDRVR